MRKTCCKMATYEDSKPFVCLQQDAKDFQSLLVEGVKTCLDHLDSKLSNLVCDPDSLQHLTKDNKRFNAHMEFTKAKYEIFMHMKSLVEEMDAAWGKKMNNMINNFLENVEILLAGMKLESVPEIGHNESPSISKRSKGYNISPSSIISSISPYSLLSTAKRIPVLNSFLPKGVETKDHTKKQNIEEEASSEDIEALESSPLQRKDNATQRKGPEIFQKKNSRKSILKTETENDLHTTPSRSTRKRTAVKEINQSNYTDNVESNESDYEISTVSSRTPKNVHFSIGFDVHDDLDIYSPEVKLAKCAPRRKTISTKAAEFSSDTNQVSARTKRKTIGSAMDVSVAPSPKRIKRSTRASTTPLISEESDLLESDESISAEHYTPWQLLDELSAEIPQQPGVYELKVYKAKKSAYIGSCENLMQRITQHKVGNSSGHKHLDKFLERNKTAVQVRFERMLSIELAKNEEMNRVEAFVKQHKTTPAYN